MRRFLAAAWPCLLTILLVFALLSLAASSSGATTGRTEWQVLTRANFSSQIRLHRHVLLIVTMPWYGESRSLMAEIKNWVATDEQELGRLKLMVMYRNSEKLLTDAIGATEGIKFIYYQNSIQFKYQGKLRARDILHSVRYTMSLEHEEAPFMVLHTKEDVANFIESTDKAVLLSEFCGWFTRLAHGGSNRSYDHTSSRKRKENVNISRMTLTRESDGPLDLVKEDEELPFGGAGQLTGSPWKGGFTLANVSVSDETERTIDENRKLCTVEKFQQFESFYEKLTALSREYFRTPERAKFGVVTERSSLPSLDAFNECDQETWFLSIHYLGCTTCSVLAKEGDDLRSMLQSHHNLGVKEIDIDQSDAEATFPANRPSAVLFIDRLSDSSKVRDESKLFLKLLREYVQKNYPSHVTSGGVSSGSSRKHSKVVPSVMSTGKSHAHSETARLHTWASKLMGVGEKMSVMVVNDGGSISYGSDNQGSANNPLYDILAKLVHKTKPSHKSKKTRINFISKVGGIKMLSDDSKVQAVESFSIRESQRERTADSFASTHSVSDVMPEVSVHGSKATDTEYIDDAQAPTMLGKTPANYCGLNDNDRQSCDTEMEEQQENEASDVSPDFQEEVSVHVHGNIAVGGTLHKHGDEKTVTEDLDILEPDGSHAHPNKETFRSLNQQDDELSVLVQESGRIASVVYEDNIFYLDEESEKGDMKRSSHATFSSSRSLVSDSRDYTEQVTSSISDNRFVGSFFFYDGGYRLLSALTGGSTIPSLVIIDPVQQKHYVFPQGSGFSYPALSNYFETFMNQSLSSYYRSASPVLTSKELPSPPFVNHDFREANSIPQLTANSFCPLVFGFEGCDSKTEMSLSNAENIESAWKKDVLVLFSNPWCGFCQRTALVVREVHRSFKSFASSNSQFANAQGLDTEEKNRESATKGFPAIYLIDCTSNECHHLLKSADKEELYPMLLLFPAENKSAISYEGGMTVANIVEFLDSHSINSRHLSEYKGFLWKKRTAAQHNAPQPVQFHTSDKSSSSSSVGSHSPSHSERRKAQVLTGSILTATEKLGAAVPFDNAQVLIVSVDSQEGFHGLIINKRLSWDAFKNLDSSMEPIKQAPLFYGGPVVVQGYQLVSLSQVALEGYAQVVPGFYYGNIIATSRVIIGIKSGEQSAKNLWFFLGYSGWGYNQLFEELSEGAWHLSVNPIEHLDWPASWS